MPPSDENTPQVDVPKGHGPDKVAQRAFERFQMRGGNHGQDQEDWFEAERELKDESGEPSE
jgi:hypothetical protein